MAKRTSSIGILDLLTLLFIGLKLAGKINWSWWWVFSPIWIACIIYFTLAIIIKIANDKHEKMMMEKDPNYLARKAAEMQMREIIERSEKQRNMFE